MYNSANKTHVQASAPVTSAKANMKLKPISIERQSQAKVYAVMNNKGGCGKTTLAIALGVTLARMGKNVLFWDSDPQTNMSQRLSVPEGWRPRERLGSFFQDMAQIDRGTDVGEYTKIGRFPFLYRMKDDQGRFYSNRRGTIGIMPGDHFSETDALAAAVKMTQNEMVDPEDRDIYQYFRKKVRSYLSYYDAVVMDTAPALEGNLQNTLIARTADEIIAPIDGLEAAFGIRNLLGWVNGSTSPSKTGRGSQPNITFAMVKYQPDSRWTSLTDPLTVRNSVYGALKEVFSGYVCDVGVHESLVFRGKVPGFGRRTEYDQLAIEIFKKLSTPRRSIFGYADASVLNTLQAKLTRIERESQWKRPEFLEPNYL